MKKEKTTLHQFLENIIPQDILKKVNRAFEVVGDIAIIEVDEETSKFSKEIGEAVRKVNPSIKTVLKKSGIHGGEFRTQDLEYVCGENKKETIYTENNVRLKINPETVYFSAKLSTEREQLMSQIEDNSRVLVMFSGCGPYSYVALRKNPDIGRITSIELNPEGHKYALESLDLNKNIIKKSEIYDNLIGYLNANEIPAIEKILRKNLNYLKLNFINGDVTKVVKELPLKFIDKENQASHNDLIFKQHPHYIVDELNDLKEGSIIELDFHKTKDPEDLVPFLIMFATKFNFEIKIDGANYLFKSGFEKGLLLNYLEKDCKISIDEIHKFDEIFMPLPKDASLFLDSAFEVAAKNSTIHMYDFVHEKDFPHVTEGAIIEKAKELRREVEILQTRKVGQYAPGKYRVCCDFIIK